MSGRSPTHRYLDPLDHVWLATARKLGLRVRRSDDAYAATDGRDTLSIAHDASLDADDCLAQMIFHEICHWLVEGEDARDRPDWGLDNVSERDVPREHACLRLQAFLAARHGLRTVLAPTTDYRAFYDDLPADPFEPRREPSTTAAILAAQRADKPPWAPHLERALIATAAIARTSAEFELAGAELPALWPATDAPAPAHASGLAGWPSATTSTCGECAWRDESGRCRQAELAVEASWARCERFEPALDCNECGACCRAAYHSVTVAGDDPVVEAHPELIVDRGDYLELQRNGNRCIALAGGTRPDEPFRCTIYADRPRPCREFENAGQHCLTARRRVGLSL